MDKFLVVGQQYMNRTSIYLEPLLVSYGRKFSELYANLPILGIGIGDHRTDYLDGQYDNHLFILVDSNINTSQTSNLISHINATVKLSLIYKYNIKLTTAATMLVIELPNIYVNAVNSFKAGRYREIVSIEDGKNLYDEQHLAYKNIVKEDQLGKTMINMINEELNVKINKYDGEYDFPPKLEEEIFNYGKY